MILDKWAIVLDKCLFHLRSWCSLFCTFRSAPAARGHETKSLMLSFYYFNFFLEAKYTSEGLWPTVENMSLGFQFSLVQCRMGKLCVHRQAHNYVLHPILRSFPGVATEMVLMLVWMMALPGPSSLTSFMSLSLCPQLLSQAPQHITSSEPHTTCDGCFPAIATVRWHLLFLLRAM